MRRQHIWAHKNPGHFKNFTQPLADSIGDTKLNLSFANMSLPQNKLFSSKKFCSPQDIAELFRPPFYENKSANETLEKVWPHYVLPML